MLVIHVKLLIGTCQYRDSRATLNYHVAKRGCTGIPLFHIYQFWPVPVGKNSQNSAHLRKIRIAPALRRRKCELLRKIRIAPSDRRRKCEFFSQKIFRFSKKMRRVFAGANANYFSQMRKIFNSCEFFAKPAHFGCNAKNSQNRLQMRIIFRKYGDILINL